MGTKNSKIPVMPENFLTLVLTSSALATVLTTIVKYCIDLFVAPRLQGRQTADQVVEKLRPRLIESAEAADSYIRLLLRFRARSWYSSDDDYFKLSLLYSVGQFFAYHHVASVLAHPDLEKSSAIASDFDKYSKRAIKSLSGYAYQRDFSPDERRCFEGQEVPRRAIQAMAELMITEEKASTFPGCISFIEFVDKINGDERFIRWFGYLDRVFRKIEESKNDTLCFERFVLFSIGLRVFCLKLHPIRHRRIGKAMILYHIYDVDDRSAKRLRSELEEANIGYEYPHKKDSGDESYRFKPQSRLKNTWEPGSATTWCSKREQATGVWLKR